MTPVQVLNELAIQLGIESPNWSAYAIEMIAKYGDKKLEFTVT